MSQVSRRKVQLSIENKIYNTLFEAIAKLRSEKEIQEFLNDLLSPTERIMVAKRLAIAALLLKGYQYETISDILKVSSTTIGKVSIALSVNKGYKIAIQKVADSEATRAFWQDVQSLVYRLSSPGKVFMPEGAIKYKLGHEKKTLL